MKGSKSEKIREALIKDKTLTDKVLAGRFKVTPGLVYQVRWKMKHGKKAKRKIKTRQDSAPSATNSPDPIPSVSTAKPTSTLTDMITTLQEALVVLNRIRGIVG